MKAAWFIVAAGALLVAWSAPASAQAGAGKCAALAADYDQIEKAMASRWADGIADNSAPRATLRQMEDANGLAQAQIILTLMQASKCPLPDHAPSLKRYVGAALACSTASLKGGRDVPECKMESWQPDSPRND